LDWNNDRISCDPKVMMGKPVVAGTHVTVESILKRLAAGESETQILEANPRLTPADIRAALQCAAEVLHGDRIYPHEIAAKDPAVNLVADENVDAGIVSALRDAGHAVTYVRETAEFLAMTIQEPLAGIGHGPGSCRSLPRSADSQTTRTRQPARLRYLRLRITHLSRRHKKPAVAGWWRG
jgi:uncharacterized protein (DUF433 family)